MNITLEQRGFDIHGSSPWATVHTASATARTLAKLAREHERSVRQYGRQPGAYQGMHFRLRLGSTEISGADLADALSGRETWSECLRTIERTAGW